MCTVYPHFYTFQFTELKCKLKTQQSDSEVAVLNRTVIYM